MKIECKDVEKALRRQKPELMDAVEQHSATCADCQEKLRQWREISAAALALRRSWDSPALWPRIHQALTQESVRSPSRNSWRISFPLRLASERWRAFVLAMAVLLVTTSVTWILWRNFQPGPDVARKPLVGDDKRLLTDQALREIEDAEAAYTRSIEKLAKLADPRLQQANSPLLISYREKLITIDSAIAELRANIERNRFNTHLRQELLSVYHEKQRTLMELMREEKHVSQ